MKRYPKYKPSNISWVGDIPNHWEIKKVKYFSYLKGRIGFHGLKSSEFIEKGPYLVTGTDFENGKINWNSCYHITEERYWEDTHIHLRDGDLLITKDGTIGKTAIVENKPSKATLNSGVLLIRPTQSFIKTFFFYYCLNSDLFNRQIDFLKRGTTINHLYQETFANFVFIAPSPEEQQQIVTYLDNKTQKIDKLISNKQKQIELLKEERQAIINSAVTGKTIVSRARGGDGAEDGTDVGGGGHVVAGGVSGVRGGGNVADATAAIATAAAAAKAAAEAVSKSVKYKPSGIPWLGDIPEHWELKKLKYLLKATKGSLKPGPFGSDLKNSDVSMFGAYKVYTQKNIIENDFSLGDDFITDDKFEELKVFQVFPSDILVTTRGTIGKATIFPSNQPKGIIHPCLIRLRMNQLKILNEWLLLYVNMSSYFIHNVKLNSNSTVIDVIYGDTLRDVFIPLPSIEEQEIILRQIHSNANSINNTISKIDKEISLLQEYRTALISEVVTGKIDVRKEVFLSA